MLAVWRKPKPRNLPMNAEKSLHMAAKNFACAVME
jgi:hypothetical protein